MTRTLSRRQFLRLSALLGATPWLSACQESPPLALVGETMGTRYRVRPAALPPDVRLPALKREIELVLHRTDVLMSLYRPQSELSQVNALPAGQWWRLSPDSARVVSHGLQIMGATGGAYNPTVGPLVNLWGFGATSYFTGVPDRAEIEAARGSVGGAAFEFDRGAIRRLHERAALDLNAIAKGDAVDRVAALLKGRGIGAGLVEIGGEVCAWGGGSQGEGWRVGIEHPDGGVLSVVRLDGGSIATSGDYVQCRTDRGKRISHLLDPVSGNPVSERLALVSVVTGRTLSADAWATALMVMGLERGLGLALENDMAALFLERLDNGYRVHATPAYQRIEVGRYA